MNLEDYYYTLNEPFLDVQFLKSLYTDKKDFYPMLGEYGIKTISNEISDWKTNSLKQILKEFKADISLFRFDPYTYYHWHVDFTHRTTAINILLEGDDSDAFFALAEKNKNALKKSLDYLYTKYQLVDYSNSKIHLLNLQKLHGNFVRSQPRILLSLSFRKPVTYQDVLNFCKEKQL